MIEMKTGETKLSWLVFPQENYSGKGGEFGAVWIFLFLGICTGCCDASDEHG